MASEEERDFCSGEKMVDDKSLVITLIRFETDFNLTSFPQMMTRR
jgi:hypothetical protein